MNWLKKKDVSLYVRDFIKTFQEYPERFDIEYCRRGEDCTHIQLRDKELGFSEGGWIYIKNRGYWYTKCCIGDQVVAENLANVLTPYEIDCIYGVVKERMTHLTGEEKEKGLMKNVG